MRQITLDLSVTSHKVKKSGPPKQVKRPFLPHIQQTLRVESDIHGDSKITPKPYQAQNLSEIEAAFQKHKRVLFVAGCGYGKTDAIAGTLARKSVQHGRVVWFIVDDLTLLDQSAERFRDNHGLRSNIVQGDRHRDPLCKVQIISVQTLASWMKKRKLSQLLYAPDLVIIDEAHTTCFRREYKHIEDYCKGRILLLTATPCRTKPNESMSKWCDALVEAPPRTEMIRLGRIVPTRFFSFIPDADYSTLKTSGEDYQTGQVAKIATKQATLDSTINQTIAKAGDRLSLVFCVTRVHADLIIQGLRSKGKAAAGRFGDTTKAERIEQNRQMATGKLQFMVVVGCCIKGYDFPPISCIVFTYATASRAKIWQSLGRGERACDGKKDSLFLDFGGNVQRHEMTEDPVWDISDRSQSDIEIIEVKECPECNWLNLKSSKECVKCGHVFEVKQRLPNEAGQPKDEHSGVLVELSGPDRYWESEQYKELRECRKSLYEKTKERVSEGRNGVDLSFASYKVYQKFKLKDDWFPPHWYKGMLLGDAPSPDKVKEFIHLLKKAFLPTTVSWQAELELGKGWEKTYGEFVND